MDLKTETTEEQTHGADGDPSGVYLPHDLNSFTSVTKDVVVHFRCAEGEGGKSRRR